MQSGPRRDGARARAAVAPVRIALALALQAACLTFVTPALAFVDPATRSPRLDQTDRRALEAAPARLVADLDAVAAGRWQADWNPQSGTLGSGRRGTLPALQATASAAAVQRAADEFRRGAAALLGADVPLEPVRRSAFGRSWHVTWRQTTADGTPILDATLDLVLDTGGRVVAFTSYLVPHAALPASRLDAADLEPAASAAVGRPVRIASSTRLAVALAEGAGLRLVPAVQLELRSGWAETWDAIFDAQSGACLRLESRLRTAIVDGRASADVVPLYAHDALVERPLPWLHIDLSDGTNTWRGIADAQGGFAIDAPSGTRRTLTAALTGEFLRVTNDFGRQPGFSAPTHVPGRVDVHFGPTEAQPTSRAIYVHANRMHDFARDRFGFTDLDFPVPAVAGTRNPATGDSMYGNAYWDGRELRFGNGAAVYYDFGQFADIIYHEYVHAITDYMYRPLGGLIGIQGSALHEGLSDYFACTLTGEPQVGEHLFRDPAAGPLRSLDHFLHWPEDARFLPHHDGMLFGGALWHLRGLVGAAIADPLVHFARTHGPRTFPAYIDAILLEDDLQFGDGAAANGSPHRQAILAAFGTHGLGPTASFARTLVHTPLRDTEDTGRARRVQVRFASSIAADEDSVVLLWSNGGPFESSRMTRQADGGFVADIPAAATGEGSAVRYWVHASPRLHLAGSTSPPGAPDSVFTFRAGPDREPPRIAHAPIATASALGWPARVLARIDDNLGVHAAWIQLRRDGGALEMTGMRRDVADPSLWHGEFPNIGGIGTTIEYWVVAVDGSRSALQAAVPPLDGAGTRFTIVVEHHEDFELTAAGWQHASSIQGRPDPWHWAVGENHTAGGTRSFWCGTPGEEYPTQVVAALETQPLPLGSGARASIWSRIDLENNGPQEAFDAAVIEIELDGDGTWRPLVPAGGYTHRVAPGAGLPGLAAGRACFSGRDWNWRELQLDLAPYAGHRARIRFLLATDTSRSPFGLRGWTLDDWQLHPGTPDPTDVASGAPRRDRLLVALPGPSPSAAGPSFDLWIPNGSGRVQLDVYDARGRRVRGLLDGVPPAGARRIAWDGRADTGLALAAGVYYYRLVSRHGVERGTVVLAH